MQIHRNGFVFIETIIAVVVLTSSLLLLYSTFTKVLQAEKTRINYDDTAYVYRTYQLKKQLNNLNIMPVIKDITIGDDNYFMVVGLDSIGLFQGYEKEKNYMANLLTDYEVSQMLIVRENKIDNLKECTLACSLDKSCSGYESCNTLYTNVNENLINYLDTIYVDVSATNILVVEYNSCNKDNTNCKNYYGWVGV